MEQNRKNEPRMHHNQVFTDEMPLGFGMALTQNPSALDRFAKLSDDEKRELIGSVHGIRSKEEMRAFVENFAGNDDAKKIF